MHTTLTSKGQLVVPKPVRDALRLRPGTRLDVRIEDAHIVLEPVVPTGPEQDSWLPANPSGKHLSTDELCAPVSLDES